MTHVFREWIRPNFLPQSLEVAIDRARTRRTVATSAESVKVQRDIAVSQAQWLSKVLDAQRDGNALLRNVSDDLSLLVDAIQMSVQGFAKFADRVDQRLAHQQERLASIERFSQHLLDGIERSVRIQERQLKVQNDQLLTLGRIDSLLTSPEATKVREQLQLAMARYRRGLDSSNPDSADDLDDALRLFEGIVGNPVGNQIHGVWYYLGILYESHAKDLRKAPAAYKNAQRLAADLDDKDGIYLDSVLSLCRVHYRLQEYAEAYSRIIGLVQRYPGHTGVAFDAACYCAVTGREGECFAFLRQCLAKDRLLYVKIFDADFAALPGFDAFIAALIAEAKAEVLPDVQHLEKTLAFVERALRQYDLAPLEEHRKRMGELLSELETCGYVGAPKVQTDVRRLNNSLILSAEHNLGLVTLEIQQKCSEIESKKDAASSTKELDLKTVRVEVMKEIDQKATRFSPDIPAVGWAGELSSHIEASDGVRFVLFRIVDKGLALSVLFLLMGSVFYMCESFLTHSVSETVGGIIGLAIALAGYYVVLTGNWTLLVALLALFEEKHSRKWKKAQKKLRTGSSTLRLPFALAQGTKNFREPDLDL